ncbi:heme oxygenase (biliverdin-producing) [Corynebacterium choanae]|uniref:Heme oxygenase n=1 Tax=Corynebacterium choanae TaxID=1862358 RepID=A0A3G6J3D3_9CORY|nr:biliverdin-producing heme oxygenase [Corynebacterium choanae]AZA12575.1 Heme oxygenase [Corynebacterium choanae]
MTTPTLTLAESLKCSTQQAHNQAEHSTFMTDLLEGRLPVAAFIALQQQSLLVYSALETALDHFADDPRLATLGDRRLDRASRLRDDLAALGVRATQANITALPATAAYVDSINSCVTNNDLLGLLAHHYVRYLGDLSGGQIIARRMMKYLALPAEALSFYDFSELGKIKPYKDRYREALSDLGERLSDAETHHMAAEATRAFHHNFALFSELGAQYPTPAAPGETPDLH